MQTLEVILDMVNLQSIAHQHSYGHCALVTMLWNEKHAFAAELRNGLSMVYVFK